MATLCQAIAKSGSRCKNPVLAGKQHCLFHDPDAGELRRAGSRKGGQNRSAKARATKQIPAAMDAETLAGWLSLLFTNVMAGRIEPKIGTACASIARVLHEVKTVTELEQRLSELEQRAGVMNDRRFG
jgi:hypothetical protein